MDTTTTRNCPVCGQDGFQPSQWHEKKGLLLCRSGYLWGPESEGLERILQRRRDSLKELEAYFAEHYPKFPKFGPPKETKLEDFRAPPQDAQDGEPLLGVSEPPKSRLRLGNKAVSQGKLL